MSFNIRSNKIKLTSGSTYTYSNNHSMNTYIEYGEIDYSNNSSFDNNIQTNRSCYDVIPTGGSSPFAIDPMVNTSGEIANFTDYQKSLIGMMSSNDINKILGTDFSIENKDDRAKDLSTKEAIYKGKTLWELYNSSDCPDNLKGKLEGMINYGMGDFEIVEVVNGVDGFSALVYKDADGNYLLSFPCTDEKVQSDIIYDAEVVSGLDLDQVNDVFGTPIDAANNSQKEQAYKLAKEYFDKAKAEGKQINIGGYSLGGSLAEYVYLELASEKTDILYSLMTITDYKDNETLGNLMVYEPLHNDLNEKQVEFLKELYKKGKIDIFAVVGSTVSTYHNYEDLKDITNFIEANAINRIKDSLVYDSDFAHNIIHGKYEFEYASVDLYKALRSIMSEEEIEKICLIINNYKTLYSGNGHAVDNPIQYASENFNEDGSFKNFDAESMSFTEITEEVFGTDMYETFALMEDAVTIMDDVVDICGDAKKGNILEAILSSCGALKGHGGSYSKIFTMTSNGVDLHKRKFVMDTINPYREWGVGSLDVGHFVDGVFTLYDEGREFFSNPIGYVADGASNFAAGAKKEWDEFVDDPLGYTGEKIECGFKAVYNEGKEIVKDIGNGVKSTYNAGKKVLGDIKDAAVELFTSW